MVNFTNIWAGIFKQSMGARNRVGIGLSYRPARLHRLAKFIPWNRFLGSINVWKYRLCLQVQLHVQCRFPPVLPTSQPNQTYAGTQIFIKPNGPQISRINEKWGTKSTYEKLVIYTSTSNLFLVYNSNVWKFYFRWGNFSPIWLNIWSAQNSLIFEKNAFFWFYCISVVIRPSKIYFFNFFRPILYEQRTWHKQFLNF